MLRYLGDVDNIVKFQQFCGLQWDNTPHYNNESSMDENSNDEHCDEAQHLKEKNDALGGGSPEAFKRDEYYKTAHNDSHCNGFSKQQSTDSDDMSPEMTSKNNNFGLKRCGCTINGITYRYHKIIHEIFKFGSELGNEAFYITFLPFVFWNVDDYIGRRLIILWVFNMYAGQGLKDLLCWPRPDSPPVLRLDQIYESEFGMPSTHAVAGSIIPFGLVYFTYDRFQYKLIYGLCFFVAWTSLVCFSRIYRGMHTFQDIVAGLSVAAFVTALWLPYLDLTLEIFLASPNAWIFIVLVPILMIYAFPTRCMETRNDTVRIISVGCGCMLAAWKDYCIDQVPLPQPYKGAPMPILPSGIVPWALFGASRFAIGISLIIPLKIFLKGVIHNLAAFVKSTGKSTGRLANEVLTLPYLFITYTAIGFTAVYVAPKAFEKVGLIF